MCGSSSVVECHLAKVDVAGPNPVYRFLVWARERFRFKVLCVARGSKKAERHKPNERRRLCSFFMMAP